MSRPNGRFAPSPTGELHVGNAASALAAWLAARSAGGTIAMRIEDLDRGRSRPEWIERALDDTRWLGLDWDGEPILQSERDAHYLQGFEQLREAGHLYRCSCSRKDIAAAASAPQEPGEERLYPGTCRESPERDAPHAWRFRVDTGESYEDLVLGRCDAPLDVGDFVVRRRDGSFAYQLAVVVDDIAGEVNQVVRGADLVRSTFRQLALYRAFDAPAPRFAHVPLIHGSDGTRLSKRHRGVTLRELRERGLSPAALVGWIAHAYGWQPTATPITAPELLGCVDWASIRPRSERLSFDPDELK